MLKLSQTNKQFQTLINKNLMHFINTGFNTFPQKEKEFIEKMKTNIDRFKKLTLAEIILLFKYYKTDVTNFTNLYNIAPAIQARIAWLILRTGSTASPIITAASPIIIVPTPMLMSA